MKLKGIKEEELELMTYDEIAYKILEESKKKMKINELFQNVCDLLHLSEDDFVNYISEFFETLTTNQKFIMLENGYWDIRTRHSEKMIVEEDDEEFEEEVSSETDEEENEEKEAYYDEDDIDDDTEDDLKDLVIIDDEEEEI